MHFCLKIQFHLRRGMPKPYQLSLRLSSLLLCVVILWLFKIWSKITPGQVSYGSRLRHLPSGTRETRVYLVDLAGRELTKKQLFWLWVKGNCIMIYVRATSSIGCISIYILQYLVSLNPWFWWLHPHFRWPRQWAGRDACLGGGTAEGRRAHQSQPLGYLGWDDRGDIWDIWWRCNRNIIR